MNAPAVSMNSLGGWSRIVRHDVLERALRSVSRNVDVPGAKMSSLDQVIPQATQIPLLNQLVEMVVLGEDDLTWIQLKIGFKGLRNVYYYLEAARWARLIMEEEVRATSLGRRYVRSRFDPRVVLEGVRGRALFEEVMRVTGGDVPTPELVIDVLRRWSFRYSKGTLARRAHDFCTLIGRIINEAANPAEIKLVICSAWVDPQELNAIDGVATIWPALQFTPIKGIRRSKKTSVVNKNERLGQPFTEEA